MKVISNGQSVFGATVLFEHGGKNYLATGQSCGVIISQIYSAIDTGQNLDELFTAVDSDKESGNKSLDEAVAVQSDSEDKPKPESKPAKGVKARG